MKQLVLKRGDVFEGRYELLKVLGRGGFSAVFLAEDLQKNQKVAVKVLVPETTHSIQIDEENLGERDPFVRRFEHEFQVVSRLEHEATIRVYDFGKSQQGALFMVLEYVEGCTVDEYLEKEGVLGEKELIPILRSLLEALGEAHEQGVLHRDIKPPNIMLVEGEEGIQEVKLLDFGVAKTMEMDDKTVVDLTKTGLLVGTPRYMAPEQIENRDLGPAADIYSLGLVMYELLTGERGIQGSTAMEVLSNQIRPDSAVLPSDLEIEPQLRAIVNRMLEKEVERRFATTGEVLKALDAEPRKVRVGLSKGVWVGVGVVLAVIASVALVVGAMSGEGEEIGMEAVVQEESVGGEEMVAEEEMVFGEEEVEEAETLFVEAALDVARAEVWSAGEQGSRALEVSASAALLGAEVTLRSEAMAEEAQRVAEEQRVAERRAQQALQREESRRSEPVIPNGREARDEPVRRQEGSALEVIREEVEGPLF